MRKLILSVFILFLLLIGTVSEAQEVMLQWTASIDAPYLHPSEGYRVYMTELEGEYTSNNLIGSTGKNNLSFIATLPGDQAIRWFVITAVDTNYIESDKSNEVCTSDVILGCPGDFDKDGDVDGADLAIFSEDFGRTDCSGGQ